jgi:DNA-binding transcriptional regulator YbjK
MYDRTHWIVTRLLLVDKDVPPRRRTDPGRRDRIIDVALDVIAERGVEGCSHRTVAAAAAVPLGSMTYHFRNMDELLSEAFTRFSESIAGVFDARMKAATTRSEAVDAVVAHIHQDLQLTHRDFVLLYELASLAARRPEFRPITKNWMRASRRSLERHFEPTTARFVDAYLEGVVLLFVMFGPRAQSRAQTRIAIARLTATS